MDFKEAVLKAMDEYFSITKCSKWWSSNCDRIQLAKARYALTIYLRMIIKKKRGESIEEDLRKLTWLYL